jgi:hypothetical protein
VIRGSAGVATIEPDQAEAASRHWQERGEAMLARQNRRDAA